jgi:hypothetical protein
MGLQLILGATGAGKTTALVQRYLEFVHSGARTDQILVLAAGGSEAERFRAQLNLPTTGPVEVHTFFGFVQGELNLFWAAVQATEPDLKTWVGPEFLSVDLAARIMQGLVEPPAFSADLLAPPERIAGQLVGHLGTAAAAAGLSPEAAVHRLAEADRAEKAPLYQRAQALLAAFRSRCLKAGMLDYGLALHLFTHVLMRHSPYVEYLQRRVRYLLVDDLDETSPAEQGFIAALAGAVDQAVCAFGADGGHAGFRGADPQGALARFRPGAELVTLPGSHTTTAELFVFGEALYQRIQGEAIPRRFGGVVTEHIATDLRGDMVEQVVAAVESLLAQGVPPEAVAVLTPRPDQALEVSLWRALGSLAALRPGRRLVDDPYVRAVVTLADLVQPYGQLLPRSSAGAFAEAMRVLLRLDPIRAAALGEAIQRKGGLPEDPRPFGLQRLESYRFLRTWVEEARARQLPPDAFARDAVAEALVPLAGDLPVSTLDHCRQLVLTAHRYCRARERFGEGAFGPEYVPLLTEAALGEAKPAAAASGNAVVLATPYAYLAARLTSQVQVWVDISGDGWFLSDVKELANPHVLAPGWPAGERWTDRHNRAARLAGAARTARALVRRCTGTLVLAECSLSAWGQEQDGGLAEAFGDLIREEVQR